MNADRIGDFTPMECPYCGGTGVIQTYLGHGDYDADYCNMCDSHGLLIHDTKDDIAYSMKEQGWSLRRRS